MVRALALASALLLRTTAPEEVRPRGLRKVRRSGLYAPDEAKTRLEARAGS